LRKLRPDLPEGVVELVERAMARSPAQRPQSMGALAAELRALAAALGAETPPPQVVLAPPRRESADGPFLAGSVMGGRSLSWLGLPRRAFTAGATVLGLLVVVVIVRAAVRTAPPPPMPAEVVAAVKVPVMPKFSGPPVTVPLLPDATGEPEVPAEPLVLRSEEDLPRPEPEPAANTKRVASARPATTGTAADRRKWMEEGRALFRARRFDEARVAFGRVLEKKPNASALLGLAEIAFQEGNFAEAVKRATEAGKAGGGARAYQVLGDSHYKVHQYAEAKKAYVEALKLEEGNEAAKRMLSIVERKLQ
jgi:tetratricopeptide (TPR) repeat protein